MKKIHNKYVLFNTGSHSALKGFGSGSVAANLAAAITSSNGHGTKFSVSRNIGVLTISQSVAGREGNTTITYNDIMTGSLTAISSSFGKGSSLENKISFSFFIVNNKLK